MLIDLARNGDRINSCKPEGKECIPRIRRMGKIGKEPYPVSIHGPVGTVNRKTGPWVPTHLYG